ncbi:hypothetical protein RKD37_000639 [Streptomyces ambofaciens]
MHRPRHRTTRPDRRHDAARGLAPRGTATGRRRPPRGDRRRVLAGADGRPGHGMAAARLGHGDPTPTGRHLVQALDPTAGARVVRRGQHLLPPSPAGARRTAGQTRPHRGRHRGPRADPDRHGRRPDHRGAARRHPREVPRGRQRRPGHRARRRPRPTAPGPRPEPDLRAPRTGGPRPRARVRRPDRRFRAGTVPDRGLVHHPLSGDRRPRPAPRPHHTRVPGRRAQGRQGRPRPRARPRRRLRRPAPPGPGHLRRARTPGALQLPGPLRRGLLRRLATRPHHGAAGRAARPADAPAPRPGVQRDRRTRPHRRVRAGHRNLLARRPVHRRGHHRPRRLLRAGPHGACRAGARRPLAQRLPPAAAHPGRRRHAGRTGAAGHPAADPAPGGPLLPLGLRRRRHRQLRRAATADPGGRGGPRPAGDGGHPPARPPPEPCRAVRGPGRRPRGLRAGERRRGTLHHAGPPRASPTTRSAPSPSGTAAPDSTSPPAR